LNLPPNLRFAGFVLLAVASGTSAATCVPLAGPVATRAEPVGAVSSAGAPPSATASAVDSAPRPATSAGAATAAAGSGRPDGPPAPLVCDETRRRLPPDSSDRIFGYGGYFRRDLTVTIGGNLHCVEVLYPDGDSSHGKVPCHTSEHIDAGWYRLLANTLARLPESHAGLVHRFVIDNRPKEHGIAPFNRQSADDARDGHTIWLHERLFEEPNHWAFGNHGRYWSYHVDRDDRIANDADETHALFSPVLIHEIGHLVSYRASSEDATGETIPACAEVCGGKSCKKVPQKEREAPCISPYCMPFKNDVGTENFAEQYRFFFQSSVTRRLLAEKKDSCFPLLESLVPKAELATPWEAGAPDLSTFHRSLWKSCRDSACKPY
jgi:hypothetical protein